MPTKFPIDYQPGKVQGFLISKETGQMIEATPLTEITPKPWPIDDIEIETEPEPPKSLTLSGTFTLKTKMKANQRRKLIRALSGKQKLPRKLKKAFKHIQLVTPIGIVEETKLVTPIGIVEETKEHKFQIIATEYYKTRNGYPYTKWVRKAIRIATKERQEMLGRIMVSLEEHFEQIRKGETL